MKCKDFWIAVTIVLCLFTLVCCIPVRAGTVNELARLIQDKVVIHKGTCSVDKDGKLVGFQDPARVGSVPCVAGINPDDPTKHYVIIFKDEKPYKVIIFDVTDMSQDIAWKAGSEV